jgi:hypothetical protein
MSPMAPPAPDCFGSVRQAACFWPVARASSVSQSCAVFGLHDPDLAELALGDHLARLPDHRIAGVVVGEAKTLPVLSTSAASFFASSASVVVSGLSQMTWMPAFEEGLGGRDSARCWA